jgi:hypothetical protein
MGSVKSRRKTKQPIEYVGLRGGIEVMLKNSLTGEILLHEKGLNAVLNAGRNALMTRALNTISQALSLVPCVIVGSGTTTANASDSGPLAYQTFKTGGFTCTTGSGATAPVLQFTASWESTELTGAGWAQSVREFALGFNSVTNSSNITTFLCRYVSAANISCTTTNQLLITYTISF